MPAIQPARLKQQAAMLSEHFAEPPAFVRSLHYMLDFYADRARRQGQTGKSRPLTESFGVHLPVLRQIILELAPLAQENPEESLELCDALWEQPYLEFRLLAAMLLGQVPLSQAEQIIWRVRTWASNNLEIYLIDALFSHGLLRMRKEIPQKVINLSGEWLNSPNNLQKQLGLRVLLPLITDPTYENLPVFFDLIHPLVRQTPGMLRPDVLDVLARLAQRTPQETAYFLRQTLEYPDSQDTPWLIRQSLHKFPSDLQISLRNAAKDAETNGKSARQK